MSTPTLEDISTAFNELGTAIEASKKNPSDKALDDKVNIAIRKLRLLTDALVKTGGRRHTHRRRRARKTRRHH